MKAEEMLDALDRMKEMILSNTQKDGTVCPNSMRIKIGLEFCEMQIRKAIEESNLAQTGS